MYTDTGPRSPWAGTLLHLAISQHHGQARPRTRSLLRQGLLGLAPVPACRGDHLARRPCVGLELASNGKAANLPGTARAPPLRCYTRAQAAKQRIAAAPRARAATRDDDRA